MPRGTLSALALCGAVLLSACALDSIRQHRSPVEFSGEVYSAMGEPVNRAAVEINGQLTMTRENGRFQIQVRHSPAYLFSIRKTGFGLLSQSSDSGIQNRRWILTPATVKEVDPSRPVFIKDEQSTRGCIGSLSSRTDTSNAPLIGTVPADLLASFKIASTPRRCSEGISIDIPANSLVDASGKQPTGLVEVTLSTVDVFSPDGMPGNYTVRVGNGESGFMETFGAGSVTITGGGRPFQLKNGHRAVLTIPVDPAIVAYSKILPASIPLLLYDEATGVWTADATAELDAARHAYVANISHFSTFNMDAYKTNPSCIKIDSQALNYSYRMEVAIPGTPVRTKDVTNPDSLGSTVHGIFNIPNNTPIGFRVFKAHPDKPGTFALIGTFAANSGNVMAPLGPGETPGPWGPNDPGTAYDRCTRGQSPPFTEGLGLVTFLDSLPAPALAAVPPTQPGVVTLSMSYLWPSGVASCNGNVSPCVQPDQYVIEESASTSFATLTSSSIVAAASSRTPGMVTTETFVLPQNLATRPFGSTRYYRVRALLGSQPAPTPVSGPPVAASRDSNTVGPITVPDQIKVRVVNNLSLTTGLDIFSDSKLVRIRVGANQAAVRAATTGPEQLSADSPHLSGTCASAQGAEVVSGNTWPMLAGSPQILVDGTTTNTPFLHIGLGDWQQGTFDCGGTSFEKRRYFVDFGGAKRYRYAEFDLTGRFGLNVITFSSPSGNPTVTVTALDAFGNAIPPITLETSGMSTTTDPIPRY